MRDQSAIFVDAGFLLAAGGQQAAGTSLRSAFKVNYGALIEGIKARARDHSGLEALRVYWYDASKDALFTDQHKRIGLLPGVKVRLGRISFNGEQKGVDLKIGLDLVGIARNRAASVAFLVSGDDDLAEAVEEAQDLGVKVVLIGVEEAGHRLGVASVAEHLALRVDSIITLPAELIASCFIQTIRASRKSSPAPTGSPSLAPVDAAPRPKPSPRPFPPLGIPQGKQFHPSQSELVYSSGPEGSGPSMGRHGDSEEGLERVAKEVGASVATSWYATTTQNDLLDLRADRPLLPPEIDRVLLKDCAQRMGEWNTDLQPIRKALRKSFWDRLDEFG